MDHGGVAGMGDVCLQCMTLSVCSRPLEQFKHCVHKLSNLQKVDLRKSPLK